MTWFPRLRVLKIVRCPNLRAMPPIPWTRTLCSIEIAQTGSNILNLTYSEKKDRKSGMCLEICAANGTDSLFRNEFAFCNLSNLKELTITNCPPLPLDKIQMLTSLQHLSITGCSSIVLSPIRGESHVTHQVPVEELCIFESDASGKELTQLLSHFPKLTSLQIERCEKITELGVSERQSGSQQQQTKEEEEIVATTEAGLLLLPIQLQKLILLFCRRLRMLPSSGGDNNEAAGGLHRLCSLREVSLGYCPDLLSSYPGSSSCFTFPTSLEELTLSSLSHMEELTNLRVSRYSKLHTLSIGASSGVLPVPICSLLSTSLTGLTLFGSKEVEPIPEEALLFLTSLQELQLFFCTKLKSLPAGLHRLASFRCLRINGCTSLRSLPKDCLPNSLHKLHISGCSMKSLPKDGLPSSLLELKISDCSELELLPTFSDGFPTSLQKLVIKECPDIKLLPKDALPSSLQELEITDCPGIKSLPGDRLQKSLRVLDVVDSRSWELKRKCRRLIGEIPIIRA
uniref:Disease resistance protein n=1 Tax=Hordeum vulgare subsp. vulgare TaxID=112509 RepID=A0A8I6XQQ5_HORVV